MCLALYEEWKICLLIDTSSFFPSVKALCLLSAQFKGDDQIAKAIDSSVRPHEIS